MEIPNWLSKQIDLSGAQLISDAVANAEAKTEAEIVPMVVSGSINTGHVPWMLFLIAIPALWALIPFMAHDWVGEVLTLVIAALFSWTFHRFGFVQRLLTPDADEAASVRRRALLEFHLANLRSTQGRTGVLVFVSMLERKAVVIADDAITAKLPTETWGETIEVLTKKLRAGDFTNAMVEAIDLVGNQLKEKFPAGPEALNELPNRLIIKH